MRNTRNSRSYVEPVKPTRERRKKKSAFRLFVQRFIVSTFWLIVLMVLFVSSYKVTIAYYDKTGGPKDERMASIINDYFGESEEEIIGQVSKNLIISQDKDGQIKNIVLGIFNPITANLDYITIPKDAQYTISNELYQRLWNAGSDIPQIIKLEDADEYFSEATLYGYMVILLEDMLAMDIGYYTVISDEKFNEVFVEELNAEGQVVYTISQAFLNTTSEIRDEENMEQFLKELAKECKSSLSLQGKYAYVPDYLNITKESIYAHGIYGIQREDYFETDIEASKEFVARIEENPIPYTQVQGSLFETEPISSKGYQIEILNASGIAGLAAFYEKELMEDGYTITHIGNYTLGTLTESKVIVSSREMGKDLLKYVGKGSVETGELPEGIDIQILLGTMAEQ